MMDEEWDRYCAMLLAEKAEAGNKVLNAPVSLCRKLHMCVCKGRGLECLHFHKNVVDLLLKPKLKAESQPRRKKGDDAAKPGPKRKPVKPLPRKWCEAGMLVLKLRKSAIAEPEVPETIQAAVVAAASQGSGGNFLTCWNHSQCDAAKQAAFSNPESPQEMFFHIGYVNYSSWHFSGLHLNCHAAPLNRNAGQPLSVGDQPRFFSFLKFLKQCVDLSCQWTVSVCQLSSTTEKFLPREMVPGNLVAFRCLDFPEMKIWKGYELERLDRQNRGEKRRGGRSKVPAACGPRPRTSGRSRAAIADGSTNSEIKIPDAVADIFSSGDEIVWKTFA